MRIITLSILTVLLLSSCASSRRLSRFYDEKSEPSDKESERANLFPLFYNNGESTSVLWPLIDKDEHGFAIRPIYNKEDNEQAFLFPLSGWNTETKEGWVGPLVWDKDYHALYPIYYKDEDDFQFLTYYDFTNSTGIFPFFHSSDQVNCFAAGLYSWNDHKKFTCHQFLWSLLANWKNQKETDDYSHYLFPWYSSKEGQNETTALFPLYYSKENSKRKSCLTPLSFSETSKTDSSLVLFPLYYSSEKYDKEANPKSSYWQFPIILPLVSSETKTNSSSNESLFGILYKDETNQGKRQGSIFGFLADWESDETSERFRFPALFDMTGLIDISQNGDTSKANYFLYSYETSPEMTRRDIFPFITWDSGKDESRFSFLWRIYETHEKDGQKGGHFFFVPWGA
ncbi:MAG: hypothetical protein NE330_13465 [Lentisphaeraceae bacterium]|nr:hypothetical protein [Lentisphaeraceae bacterium]